MGICLYIGHVAAAEVVVVVVPTAGVLCGGGGGCPLGSYGDGGVWRVSVGHCVGA